MFALQALVTKILLSVEGRLESFVDWFKELMGFREEEYERTRERLRHEGPRLRSLTTGQSYAIGQLDLVSLQYLREKARSASELTGRLKVNVVRGDVRPMHQLSENAGALFQVASQFNLLEMVSPDVTPEDGVTRYQNDFTQGPACAIAAGAATIYRNYFAPIDGNPGQTAERQLDGLADLGKTLSQALGQPIGDLWQMKNGYALGSKTGIDAISKYIETLQEHQVDVLRGKLRIGLHWDVEVTDVKGPTPPLVSQAFCSALPVSYSRASTAHWRPFASLVLEAAYEATMWAALLNAKRKASKRVLLTLLGAGAFGNDESWICSAIGRALELMRPYGLDVSIVSYQTPSKRILEMAERFP